MNMWLMNLVVDELIVVKKKLVLILFYTEQKDCRFLNDCPHSQ